jgi:hypothetical protein
MGMFDELRCRATLPDDGDTDTEFQTKSMDCRLDTYIITSDGRLTKKEYDQEDESAEPCDYTGQIDFYRGSRDYRAVFVDGRLVALRKL